MIFISLPIGVGLDLSRRLLAIHLRHLHIQQDHLVWIFVVIGYMQHFQSLHPAGSRLDPAAKAFHHLGHDHAVGGIVIHPQNVQVPDIHGWC